MMPEGGSDRKVRLEGVGLDLSNIDSSTKVTDVTSRHLLEKKAVLWRFLQAGEDAAQKKKSRTTTNFGVRVSLDPLSLVQHSGRLYKN